MKFPSHLMFAGLKEHVMKEFIQNPAGFIPLKVRKGYFQNSWKMKSKSIAYFILWMYD
jgi:hypothetical protein